MHPTVKKFNDILDSMMALKGHSDPEYAHQEADRLLCLALDLCKKELPPYLADIVELINDAYTNVERWYS